MKLHAIKPICQKHRDIIIITIILSIGAYALVKNNSIKTEEKYDPLSSLYITSIFTKATENPILSGTPGSWDANSLESPMVMKVLNRYYMYYHAINRKDSYQIGLATADSPLGSWKKYSNKPILSKGANGSWDDYAVAIGHISKIGDKYYMWYEGMQRSKSEYWPWRIGLATSDSPEGPWIKYSGNPILDVGHAGAWDSTSLYVASVEQVNGTFYMWYGGFKNGTDIDGQLGLATALAPEGPWRKYEGNPVLKPGAQGEWDGGQINEAAIIYKNGIFYAWYAGYPENDIKQANIGYANSTDGINWKKYSNNPVLLSGEVGDWDEHRISEPHVLIENNTIYLFFTGARYSEDYRRNDEKLGVAFANATQFGLYGVTG